MKVQHAHYANKKLSTEWGPVACDANGEAEVPKEAGEFFEKILGFRVTGDQNDAPKPKAKAQKAEEPKPVPVDKERQSRFSKRLKEEDND